MKISTLIEKLEPYRDLILQIETTDGDGDLVKVEADGLRIEFNAEGNPIEVVILT